MPLRPVPFLDEEVCMKTRIILLVTALAVAFGPDVFAQELKEIKLVAPDMSRSATLMTALSSRKSVREWSPKKLESQDLADLLWAAGGVNRPQEKKRTFPTAHNVQDIDLYLFNEDGVYLYDPFANALLPQFAGDHRAEAGIQEFVATAPAVLVLVCDLSRYTRGTDASKSRYAAMHAGSVSQNISLFCAGNGMGTVVIGMVDADALKKKLKLSDAQTVLLSHPVGYLK